MALPRLFIGSSKEGRTIATALRSNLDGDAEVTVWDENVFQLGSGTLETLVRELDRYDFALLVLTPDDVLATRGEQHLLPRDNVLLELGLFIGHLGRQRAFAVHDSTKQIKLPTDLAGVTVASFRGDRDDGNLVAAVGSACDKVRDSIRRYGRRGSLRVAEISLPDGQLVIRRSSDGWLRPIEVHERGSVLETRLKGVELHVRFGRIEDFPPQDGQTVVVLPANEYFDDECISDRASALGAFMQAHFRHNIGELRGLVAPKLEDLPAQGRVKKEGITEPSYDVGTCVFLDGSPSLRGPVALAAVTTQRQSEGLRSEFSFVLQAVRRVVEGMADRRLHRATFPLLGAGHGGLPAERAFFALVVALGETITGPCGSQLRHVTVVIFQPDPGAKPVLDLMTAKEILILALGMYS